MLIVLRERMPGLNIGSNYGPDSETHLPPDFPLNVGSTLIMISDFLNLRKTQ